jgi:hypothetical protein
VANISELAIGGQYVIDADLSSVYLGLTDDQNCLEELMKSNLGTVISGASKDDAIKGDEFTIAGMYFEDESSPSKIDLKTSGSKVASIIKIISGQNKNKMAVITHHKDLNSDEITKNIYEIC